MPLGYGEVSPRRPRVWAGLLVLSACSTLPAGTAGHGSTSVARPPSSVTVPGGPDYSPPPGALNPAVTQATIRSTICVAGWTRTVRPPATYTNRLKVTQIRQYGYADTNVRDYEEDHLVPLELGGAPRDPRNLWPEPHSRSSAKDTVENALKSDVCAGRRTLGQAQAKILADWGP